MSFIVPDTWLTNVFTKNLRKLILETCDIIQIISLPQRVFQDANVDTCIFVIKKSKKSKNKIFIKIMGKDTTLSNLRANLFEQIFEVDQKEWEEDQTHSFNIYQDTSIKKLISKIEKGCINLGSISEMRRGCFCYRKSSLIKAFGKKKGIEILENRMWHSFKKEDDSYKKELLGSDIHRYYFDWKNKKWFKYGKHMASYVEPIFFENGYIAIQRIRNPKLKRRIIATYIEGGKDYYASSGLTSLIIGSQEYNPNYILALLNSRLLNWYFKQFYRDVNIKPEDLRKLPIKNINVNSQKTFIKLVDKILDLNEQLVKLKDKQTDEKAHLEKEIKKTDKEIDELVYKIYGITEKEKKIIEESLN